MNDAREATYAQRMQKVRDYIARHLDQDLSVERLSEVAHFSRFHFHRQFLDYHGMNVGRYVQLMRLRQASWKLAFQPGMRIVDIALDAGFENPESFTRAFRQAFGQTPSAFRKQADWEGWHQRCALPARKRMEPMNVNIVTVAPTPVAALEHKGPPALVNDSARLFIEWRQESGLSPLPGRQTYGIAYDNPDTTAPEDFRFDICGSVDGDVPPNRQGVVAKTIPGGRCAVLRHVGDHDRLGESVYYLYRDWLPGSGEELRDFPVYFHYLNLRTQVAEHELLTDVYLPLK